MFVACPHIGLQWVALLLALIMSFTVLTTSTGAYPPESCIFGEGLNLAAFISLICSFFWYLIALERTKFMGIHQPKCVLNFMLLLSLVASIGLTLVGNFQQVNVELIHDIGAGMAFFGTTIYIILCALVSKRYLGTHWCIWAFRLLLGIMAGITSSFFNKLNSTIFLRHPLVNYFIYFVALINYSTTLKFLVLVSICHTVSRINFNGTQEESLTYRHPGQGYLDVCKTCRFLSKRRD
uniref:DNA damage-regulated autophagy modulator protein 1 n=1 Tax=Schistosoma haematobium TaxID=6185 RepID=A0A095A6P6_SCHHA